MFLLNQKMLMCNLFEGQCITRPLNVKVKQVLRIFQRRETQQPTRITASNIKGTGFGPSLL
jgi:hypothetical protein